MPYEPFLESARTLRYDIELLEHRFGVELRAGLPPPDDAAPAGPEGVPFHFIRVDIAGNISKRFSASGIRFARFSGLCPRWNVHSAFMTPGMIRTQISRMPDGTTYLCVARTVRQTLGGLRRGAPAARDLARLRGQHTRAPRLRRRHRREQPERGRADRHHLPPVRADRLRAAGLSADPPQARHRRERARGVVLHAGARGGRDRP